MAAKEFLSISELTNLLNLTLEDYIGEIGFSGEISEITRATSGHWYLTLKDELSQISAVIWASKARTLRFTLEKGVKVLCRGKPNIYPRSGRLQVVLSAIELAGEGELQKKFEALKKKLELEGLFAPERKRPLPFFPKALGIVTSATGAVIHDIMVRLQERMPQIKVYLVDVRVQGPGSAEEIAAGIKYLESQNLVDVMIVGRGGGSLEDLWAFNEEIVCRTIFSCSVPVISAVGHEVDITLADFVADKRAPTPTAAAEMVVPRRADLLEQIESFERRLLDSDRWFAVKQQDFDELSTRMENGFARVVERKRDALERLSLQIARYEPTSLLTLLQNRLELLQNKLINAVTVACKKRESMIELYGSRLTLLRAAEALQTKQVNIERLFHRLTLATQQKLTVRATTVQSLEARLSASNPEQILKRGFALVYKDNQLIRHVDQVSALDDIRVRLSDGAVWSKVMRVEEEYGKK